MPDGANKSFAYRYLTEKCFRLLKPLAKEVKKMRDNSTYMIQRLDTMTKTSSEELPGAVIKASQEAAPLSESEEMVITMTQATMLMKTAYFGTDDTSDATDGPTQHQKDKSCWKKMRAAYFPSKHDLEKAKELEDNGKDRDNHDDDNGKDRDNHDDKDDTDSI